jgi:hypothetical protein
VLELNESSRPVSTTRRQALNHCEHLKEYIVGDDGVNLLVDGKNWLVDTAVISRLQTWLSGTNDSQTLWISGPSEPQLVSSTRSAGLAVIAAAWQTEAPFISHFCDKPSTDLPRSGGSQEKVGLIGLIYDLIYQLLQFNKEDYDLDLSEKRLQQLDGSEESWLKSLSLLKDLLHHTQYLPYCIIHGLNNLEWSDGSEWCSQFLEVLFQHQSKHNATFSLFFTTSGQCRVLSQWVPTDCRFRTTYGMAELERRGKRLMFPRESSGSITEGKD